MKLKDIETTGILKEFTFEGAGQVVTLRVIDNQVIESQTSDWVYNQGGDLESIDFTLDNINQEWLDKHASEFKLTVK